MAQALKDRLDFRALEKISYVLLLCDNSLDVDKFKIECFKELESLELKARVEHIASHLHNILSKDFLKTAKILEEIPKHWHNSKEEAGWYDFMAWPIIDYVGIYGLKEPETSLSLLKKLTHLFSAEFAIRPFIKNHFNITMKHLNVFKNDKDEHVRRLVSEGVRLRLPWSKNLDILFDNIDKTLPLVLNLVDDDSLYVRKSVSNYLNDLSKYDSSLVISTCEELLKSPTKNREWIVKRATRTLRKNGIIS